jgi:hypothetical protein
MTEFRRSYPLFIGLNGRRFKRVVIDAHYEENHPDMSDSVILELVRVLNGTSIDPESEKDGFVYISETIHWREKSYRLVFTYNDEDFIGVINAFRVQEKKLW